MKKVNISNIEKVSLPGENKNSGKSLDQSSGGVQTTPTETKPPIPKKEEYRPKKRVLSPEEKLSDEYLERLDKQVKDAVSGKGAPWNIGGIPKRPGQEGKTRESRGETEHGYPGPEIHGYPGPEIGSPSQQIPGGDTRIWVDPETLEKEIDAANRQGEENERVEDAKGEREERTDTEKTTGGKGKGKGRIRDRIAVERLSQTDWASIFKTRLTAYSKENAKYLPWNRRFTSNKVLKPKIGSKTPIKDVLPELNLLVDTSSSLSYREMAVILGEIEKAMESAKVKLLNVFLWHNQPYAYKEFKDVTGKNFKAVTDWIQNNWQGGGNDEIALYEEVIKKGKAKKFTISLTDAYLDDHMREGKLKSTWTKALDPLNTIFAIVYPNKSISYEQWVSLGERMPGTKVPVFLDTKKFR
jgi:hypothetical protein